MKNTYTLEVYEKANKPLFVVSINSPIRIGVFFFNSLKEAKSFVNFEKAWFDLHSDELRYNEEGITDKNIISVIEYVSKSDDIAIGTLGRTYSKTMFPNGI